MEGRVKGDLEEEEEEEEEEGRVKGDLEEEEELGGGIRGGGSALLPQSGDCWNTDRSICHPPACTHLACCPQD